MTRSSTNELRPEITATTPTSVDTPMMMPSRVRKLRSAWARMARSASRNSSPLDMSARRAALRLRLLDLHQIARLDLAQSLEGTGDERLSALQTVEDLQRELAQETGLHFLESCLVALDQVHALFVARSSGLE